MNLIVAAHSRSRIARGANSAIDAEEIELWLTRFDAVRAAEKEAEQRRMNGAANLVTKLASLF